MQIGTTPVFPHPQGFSYKDYFTGLVKSGLGSVPIQLVNIFRSPTMQSIPVVGAGAKEAEKVINRYLDSDAIAFLQEMGTPPATPGGQLGGMHGEFFQAILPVPGFDGLKSRAMKQLSRLIPGVRAGQEAATMKALFAPQRFIQSSPKVKAALQIGAEAGKQALQAAAAEASRGREDSTGLAAFLGGSLGAVGKGVQVGRQAQKSRSPFDVTPLSGLEPKFYWTKGIQKAADMTPEMRNMDVQNFDRLGDVASRHGQKFTVTGLNELKDRTSRLLQSLDDAIDRTSQHAVKLVKGGVDPKAIQTNARTEILNEIEKLKASNSDIPGVSKSIDEYLNPVEYIKDASGKVVDQRRLHGPLSGIADDSSLAQVEAIRKGHTSFIPKHFKNNPQITQSDWMKQAVSNAIYEGARKARDKAVYKIKRATQGTALEGQTPWEVELDIPGVPRGKTVIDDVAREARDLTDLIPLVETSAMRQQGILGHLFRAPKELFLTGIPLDPTAMSRAALLGERLERVATVPGVVRRATGGAQAVVGSDETRYTAAPPVDKSSKAKELEPFEESDENMTAFEGQGAANNLFNIEATAEGNETWNGEIPQETEWQDVLDEAGNIAGKKRVFKVAMFESPADSARATAKLLQKYQQGDNRNTLYEVFEKYAPLGHGSNNPVKYAENVASWLGIKPDDKINTNDPEFMKRMLLAIVRQEQGRVPSAEEEDQISSGVDKAFMTTQPIPGAGVK